MSDGHRGRSGRIYGASIEPYLQRSALLPEPFLSRPRLIGILGRQFLTALSILASWLGALLVGMVWLINLALKRAGSWPLVWPKLPAGMVLVMSNVLTSHDFRPMLLPRS